MDYVQITKNRPQHVAGFAFCSAGTVPCTGQSCPGMDICDHPLFLFQSFHHSRRIFNCSSGLKDRLSHRSDFIHPWIPIKSNTFDLLSPYHGVPYQGNDSQATRPVRIILGKGERSLYVSPEQSQVFAPNSRCAIQLK